MKGPIIAASDWVQEIPASLTPYIEQPYVTLGTNGLGRSDTREALRTHFEIDAGSIVVAALSSLSKEGKLEWSVVKGAMKRFGIDPAKKDSMGS